MGMNYYLVEDVTRPCKECGEVGQFSESTHLGKSSLGWAFSIAVPTDDHPDSFFPWLERIVLVLSGRHANIVNELGEELSIAEFLSVVLSPNIRPVGHTQRNYPPPIKAYLDDNDADYCRLTKLLFSRRSIERGRTYQFIRGEFS